MLDSLEKKYKTEDVGVKKFVVGKFLDFEMNDTKMVMSQVEEIQIIIHDLLAKGMEVNEPFQVASIIEKLLPSCKDFKSYLKHKRNERPKNEKKQGNTKKFRGDCYNCGKPNHTAKDFRLPKKDNKSQKPRQANIVEERYVPLDIYDIDLSVVLCETNLVDNPSEWWANTGSTSHICASKEMFSSYTTVGDMKIFMGKSATYDVIGVGNVVLKTTSGKK
ncbi:uncharacterized protein [Henckelia pumila]|uniref:uncharacterized protein n=1 Tax=Henckelia pumila TaxID=405737 RepID=UPI003C6DF7A1